MVVVVVVEGLGTYSLPSRSFLLLLLLLPHPIIIVSIIVFIVDLSEPQDSTAGEKATASAQSACYSNRKAPKMQDTFIIDVGEHPQPDV